MRRWESKEVGGLLTGLATAGPAGFEIVDLAREGPDQAVEQMVSAIRRRVADEVAS